LLRELGHGERPEEVAAYFDLAYQVTDDAVLVASSGWPMPGWTPLPSGHVLVTDRRTLATTAAPIKASLPQGRWLVPVNECKDPYPERKVVTAHALREIRQGGSLVQVL
jgi:hypothetical protein